MLSLRMKISDHGGVAGMRNILGEDGASLLLQASCYLASLSLPCFVFSTYIYPSNLASVKAIENLIVLGSQRRWGS